MNTSLERRLLKSRNDSFYNPNLREFPDAFPDVSAVEGPLSSPLATAGNADSSAAVNDYTLGYCQRSLAPMLHVSDLRRLCCQRSGAPLLSAIRDDVAVCP